MYIHTLLGGKLLERIKIFVTFIGHFLYRDRESSFYSNFIICNRWLEKPKDEILRSGDSQVSKELWLVNARALVSISACLIFSTKSSLVAVQSAFWC
ncbi:Hypothetical predicted protein [Cloeon dipterum]|uniref:Uncharacterized protein n=1 Tax=Cloeon dipterum TaxID=197152 RepID=A0A8S1C3J0_9INSE|nr:Hypothetical predicted protein [Cloeon dipterum]